MSADLLLPEGSRLLHIGPHKTGSTAIQNALRTTRTALREHGVEYPTNHQRIRGASQLLLDLEGTDELAHLGHPQGRPNAWSRVVARVEENDLPRLVISDEGVGKCTTAVPTIVRDLGGRGRLHVLGAARNYGSYLPSQWQERVRAGWDYSWEDWLGIILSEESHEESLNVWQAHDTVAMVDRWVREVGADEFTLLILDGADHGQLPRTFESMLGLPDGLLVTDIARSNVGLGFVETELIRALNRKLRERGIDRETSQPLTKRAGRALQTRTGPSAPGPRKPEFPAWAWERINELSERRIDAIAQLPVRVVGDLDHLRLTGSPGEGDRVSPTGVPIDIAADAMAGIVAHQVALDAERSTRKRRAPTAPGARKAAKARRAPKSPAVPGAQPARTAEPAQSVTGRLERARALARRTIGGAARRVRALARR